MSDISRIRSLIQDLPTTVQEVLTLDGVQTAARCAWYPVVASSVTVTGGPSAPTVDGQSGMLTWGTAPAAGTYTLQYQTVMLLDATIQDLLDLQNDQDANSDDSDTLMMTAANCLDAVATNMALILRRITMLDVQTDGPAVAKALREHADRLRSQVTDTRYSEPSFDFAEQINDVFGYREKVLKDFLREGD